MGTTATLTITSQADLRLGEILQENPIHTLNNTQDHTKFK